MCADVDYQHLDGEEQNIVVALTHQPLHDRTQEILDAVKNPKAGAVVLFAGTTRDNFDGKTVKYLEYSAYIPRALQTMLSIAKTARAKHGLNAIRMIHRLGVVPIMQESILIAVSAPHRRAAWEGGEELLEMCKEKVEIWKLEEFGGEEGGIWRANRDGHVGIEVSDDIQTDDK